MKKENLMIGDWVNIQTEKDDEPMYSQVEQLWECEIDADFQTDYKNVHPIPLTSEILEKNGFKHLQDTYLFNIGINQFKIDLWIEIGPDSWIENNKIYIDSLKEIDDIMISVTTCKYVHELQHLLKMLKIEKKIVL